MTDIFLSYSSKDRERVRLVRDALATVGYDVFWDLETPIGENWDRWIRLHIAKARVVVVFWSQNSAASVNVEHEAAIARDDNKLFPAMLEPMEAIDFPMGFYTTQTANLVDWAGEAEHQGYGRLLAALKVRLSSNQSAAAQAADPRPGASSSSAKSSSGALPTPSEASTPQPVAAPADGPAHVGAIFDEDMVAAVRRYRAGAERGEASSQASLAYMHENGLGGLKKELKEAVRLYRLAATQGHSKAQARLGAICTDVSNLAFWDAGAGFALLRSAAEQGDAGAQYQLGLAYIGKIIGLDENRSEAERLFRLAADQGLPAAQLELAELICDKGESLDLLKCAANQGNAEAQFRLGSWHIDGANGLSADRTEALRFFKLAADQGHPGGLREFKWLDGISNKEFAEMQQTHARLEALLKSTE